jgi:hypothetical protein
VAGLPSPTGRVVIMDGAKKLTSVAFRAGGSGAMTVKLGKLKPGVHKLKAVYQGSDQVNRSSSKVVKLTVKKARKK